MIKNRLRALLLFAFLFTTTLVVVLQYNSNKNIDELVLGNEQLLTELTMKSKLRAFQSTLHSLDNNIRKNIITFNESDRHGIQPQVTLIRSNVDDLGTILLTDLNKHLWKKLDSLTERKIEFSNSVLDSLVKHGPEAAEAMINTGRGVALNEQIGKVTSELDDNRQDYLTQIIRKTDQKSLKAKQLGFIMGIIAAAVLLFSLFYIINHIRRQQLLIEKLNESEQQVRKAAEIKEHFIANVSHEIRTPMNAILGFTNLLQKQSLGNVSKQYVGYIKSSGENLLSILNDVLDLSKIEAGMMRIEKVPFSLRGLQQSVHTMFLSKAEEKKLELSYRLDDEIPDTLRGDAVRLTQVLVNLVSNAIKFTSQGYVRINITAKELTASTATLRITVADSGIGIPKEKIDNVFERFTQAEESTTRRFGGTGLGLSIVQQLVKLQGGNITVSSEPGSGSFFTVEIPFEVGSATELEDDVPETNLANLQQTKLLVVEDNPMNQNLMRHLLTDWNVAFEIANNGKEAVEALRINQYDLILMDIQMPEMDGYTAAGVIRNELLIDTPIIAMTAHAFAGEREKCISHGMNDYISKPIREKELHKLIGAYTISQSPNNNSSKDVQKATEKPAFKTINLTYLNELSGGNKDFEKEILNQFITQIPDEIQALQTAYDTGNWPQLTATAHNLKTTISFLGLHPRLAPYLDILEKKATVLDSSEIQANLENVIAVCRLAQEESKVYLTAENEKIIVPA